MKRGIPHVVALLATYNEERFIGGCLEHLLQQNLQVYLIDNCSTDETVAIARRYSGDGVIGIETLPRANTFTWRPLLERKEHLANILDADWFMNVDADEIRLAPQANRGLAEAFAEVESQGYNAVNFQEFTFIPTQEEPDHDHPDFLKSMHRYYPFLASPLNQVKAWKRQLGAVEFAWSAGHKARFAGMRIAPQDFVMKHYQFLSIPHALRKYIERIYDQGELKAGWHLARAALRPEMIALPSESELRLFQSDGDLDATQPRAQHFLFDAERAAQLSDRNPQSGR